jgi:hypothetical protein
VACYFWNNSLKMRFFVLYILIKWTKIDISMQNFLVTIETRIWKEMNPGLGYPNLGSCGLCKYMMAPKG